MLSGVTGFANNIGKYRLGRTVGEGTFAKVKLAVNSHNGQYVAVKIIDKKLVMESDLKFQVRREIRTMKLLHHPNIVRIQESYSRRLNECEARKLFQQLIDALDYCHSQGVYHRDLKPENLLLDNKGNLKVSDFGLSAMQKPDKILTTSCGSPCYVAPELLWNKGYDGAAADVWSCGVILFETLAGYLPFDDQNLMRLYKKICKAEYKCPPWFTESQKTLIAKILEPNPRKRITIPEIVEDKWFQTEYVPACAYECDQNINLDDVNAAFDSVEEKGKETMMPKSPSFINAFQLIAMSHDLDLSGLFEEQDHKRETTRLGSEQSINETIDKIEAAATDVKLSVERMNNSKIKMRPKLMMTRCSRSHFDLSAEVIEVAPTHCVVEISKSAGDLIVYKEFCESLSSLLRQKYGAPSQTQESVEACITGKSNQDAGSSKESICENNKGLHG